MSHPNRRADDPHDGRRHFVQDAVESTTAKVVARYGVPLLLAWMATQGREALDVQRQQGSDISQVKSDVRVLSTRFDEVALRQVASNTSNIEQIHKKDIEQDSRIDALERTVKTP